MGFSVMRWGAEKLVPAEYWCPYGTVMINLWNIADMMNTITLLPDDQD